MKLIIESTDTLTKINGATARVWRGTTETGADCTVFVSNIASRVPSEFKELMETPPPVELGSTIPGQPLFVELIHLSRLVGSLWAVDPDGEDIEEQSRRLFDLITRLGFDVSSVLADLNKRGNEERAQRDAHNKN